MSSWEEGWPATGLETETSEKERTQEAITLLAQEVLLRLNEEDIALRKSIALDEGHVETLATALVSERDPVTTDVMGPGTGNRTLVLSYLAKAARVLGRKWENDELSFAQVTVGTGRIFSLLRDLAHGRDKSAKPLPRKSAFLTPVPGEDHTLGLRMATDLLRASGWDIDLALDLSHDEIIARVTDTHPGVIGLSAAGEHALANLARLVMALRIASPNSLIFVGGQVVGTNRQAIELLNIDAIAADFEQAHSKLDDLWARHETRQT